MKLICWQLNILKLLTLGIIRLYPKDRKKDLFIKDNKGFFK